MASILVTYASMAGSTAEIAELIGQELENAGHRTSVVPIDQATLVGDYDAFVVGGPMIMGWHRQARRFLRRNRRLLAQTPLAVFVTAITLTNLEEALPAGVQYVLDRGIMKEPASPERLSLRERYSRPSNYMRPIFASLKPAKPASMAIFGGRLVYGRLPWWAVPIAIIAAGINAGDKRNWDLIRSWAKGLPAALDLG
jgi:menaquinone-dependent protoporphyrinogen IX oxidase